jgi:nucleotide-binding universal stress UspA family protein
VLVLVDGSTAWRVVPWIRRLLAPAGGDARLLLVLPPARAVTAAGRTIVFADQQEQSERLAAHFFLSGFVSRLCGEGVAASAEVRFGKPAAATLEAARDWGADAIAVVDSPARGWRRWFTRTVVDEILNHSPVPVLVTRTSRQRAA